MKSRIVKRTLALASCLFMLAGEVMPSYAAGTADDGQITEVVIEEDNAENEEDSESEDEAVSENDAEEKEDTVSDNDTISDNEAVSENEAVGDENTEDDNEDETPGDEETVSAAKPSGNPVATAALGDNVTGSIYNESGKVILYVDGKGTKMDTEFKESALAGYAITDVLFGGNVSSICDNAFEEVISIQRVVISGSILYIGEESFLGCTSLTSLTFEKGSGHLDIEDKAFKNCIRLNNVTIPKRVGKNVGDGEEYYGVFAGCTALTNAALEDGITLVPANTFIGAYALTNISIPSSVTAIGDSAFEACSSLKAFTFPANVKSIGKSAFSGTAFGSFAIPGTVTEIGSWAFMNCKALGTVKFEQGSGTLEMGDGVFKNCINLNNVTLPKRVGKVVGGETSYYSIFTGCTSLTNAALEDGISYVPKNAFAFAPALVQVTIPSSVKTIGDNAFAGCSRIGAFSLPKNLTALGRNAFGECISLTNITIPNKVKKIADYCFFGCSVLSEIKLPDSITEVGHRSFDGCYSLEKVYCSKDKSKIKIGDLNDHLKNAQWIKVAKGGKEETKTGVITLNGVAVNSLKAAFKQMKDKNKDYMIVLGSDIAGEKNLTIPSTAKSVTIDGKGHCVEITGTKLTSNVPLTLNNMI
ncbi:MAG: leucine-rich repeat protein [Lachnospiraceae bacterium]|nr:leucine-rich repeat protein [Lachnospiraceae bacterium]